MTEPKPLTKIVKYDAVTTYVRVGQTWYVQIEPVMPGNTVRRMRILDVTEKTIELEDAANAYRLKFRWPHYSVNFVELISDK